MAGSRFVLDLRALHENAEGLTYATKRRKPRMSGPNLLVGVALDRLARRSTSLSQVCPETNGPQSRHATTVWRWNRVSQKQVLGIV